MPYPRQRLGSLRNELIATGNNEVERQVTIITERPDPNSLTDSNMSDIIYHYCGVRAFREIISTKELWLSDAYYMNDYAEHRWLLDRAVEHVTQFSQEDDARPHVTSCSMPNGWRGRIRMSVAFRGHGIRLVNGGLIPRMVQGLQLDSRRTPLTSVARRIGPIADWKLAFSPLITMRSIRKGSSKRLSRNTLRKMRNE